MGSHKKVLTSDNILLELYAYQFPGTSSDESAETNPSH
jgi:hypothetical protein